MLNKKSFDLNNEEKKTNKSEKLYQPKKCRWCKCIVFPLLAGFMLLLILANVDFKGDAYNQTWLETPSKMFHMETKIINDPILLQTRGNLYCIITSDSCSVICSGGNTNNMFKELEQLYKKCGKDMEVKLYDCTFPAGKLKSNFFEGNFRLKAVNIIKSNLESIDEMAFIHDSVKNLKNLYLINTQIVSMEKSTFNGLEQLDNFQLVNNHLSWTNFNGIGFLDSFSKTLRSLLITQMTSNDIVYDPSDWINGSNMTALLSLDLSNNNFQCTLNNETFSTLLALEHLILANCNINYLPSNMFDNNLSTLKHIDLNGNHLTVLPGDMLLKMNGLNLNLNANYWDCVCDNKEMLEIIQNENNITFVEQENFQCYTPTEKFGVDIHKLSLEECFTKTTQQSTETTGMKTTVAQNEISSISTDSTSITGESTVNPGSNNSETTEIETSETSTITPTRFTTTPNSEVTTSISRNTTIPTFTTVTPTTTAKPTTTKTTTTHTITPPFSTTTTSIATTTSYPMYLIQCLNSKGNTYFLNLKQHSNKFSIFPISRTSVQMSFSKTLNNLKVLYYPNYKTPYQQENITDMPIIINNLDVNSAYVFCLISDIHSNISPFDCKSYYRPEIKAWILKDDISWIVCLVVLGICLMLLLGMILLITVKRWRLRHSKKCLNKSSDTQLPSNNQIVSDIPLRNFRDSQMSSDTLYHSRHQPPDAIATQPDCESTVTPGSNNSETTEIETSETSTITPTRFTTTTNSEVTTSISRNTTIPTFTTVTPTTTAKPTTTKTTTTHTITPPFSTTTTSIATTTSYPMYLIQCLNSKGNTYFLNLKQHSNKFSIFPISRTSVQMSFSKTLNNLKVLYYPNYKTPYQQENITDMPIIINNLDVNSAYVFCLISDIHSNISPFDCKSYYRPEIKAWILKDDISWIVCLVVLGICLMLLLGMILLITVKRWRLRHSKKCLNKSSDTQLPSNNQIVSDIPLRNFRDSQMSSDTLYHSRHQPPDAIATQPDCNKYNLALYEDLIM